jgi:hypothetical protein
MAAMEDNAQVEGKHIDSTSPEVPCVYPERAETCLIYLQPLRETTSTCLRGVRGDLHEDFATGKIGMDYAFSSASLIEAVVDGFVHKGGVTSSVKFAIAYSKACPGADVSVLSVFPGEQQWNRAAPMDGRVRSVCDSCDRVFQREGEALRVQTSRR